MIQYSTSMFVFMKKFKILLCVFIFANTSCVDYQKKAEQYIATNSLSNNIIFTHIEYSPYCLAFVNDSGIFIYNVKTEEQSNLLRFSGIKGWSSYSIDKLTNRIFAITGEEGILLDVHLSNTSFSTSIILQGNIRKSYKYDDKYVLTDKNCANYLISLKYGDYHKTPSVRDFLEEKQIKESEIFKIYDSQDRSCIFYKPSGYFFTGTFFYYDALSGDLFTYDNCYTVYDETDDGESIII